jgi:hypothetical protein
MMRLLLAVVAVLVLAVAEATPEAAAQFSIRNPERSRFVPRDRSVRLPTIGRPSQTRFSSTFSRRLNVNPTQATRLDQTKVRVSRSLRRETTRSSRRTQARAVRETRTKLARSTDTVRRSRQARLTSRRDDARDRVVHKPRLRDDEIPRLPPNVIEVDDKPPPTTRETKKEDPPKKQEDPKKTPDDAKPPPGNQVEKKDEKPVAMAPHDCLVVIRYSKGQIPTPEEDPTSATNEDLAASAALVKKGLGDTAEIGTVDETNKLEDILAKLSQSGKKCCTRMQFFGHGKNDGSLQLPYSQWTDPPDEASNRLSGDANAQKVPAQKAFKSFTDALKKALCPKDKTAKGPRRPQVAFNSCHSGRPDSDHPIAEEVSKAGITTTGNTGVCNFTDPDNENKPAKPEPAEGEKVKQFNPPEGKK